jgi:hypothetical protein
MSIDKNRLIAILSTRLPSDIVIELVKEYQYLKQQFALGKFQPSELNAARFSECALRIIEYLDTSKYTPLGIPLTSENIINSAQRNTVLKDAIRFFIPRLARVILDVRNKRDVAHVGGEVNPNYSDALFVTHCADWILTEVVRHFYSCSIDEAASIVKNINEIQIPVVVEVDGFIRVQNSNLDSREKVLVVLYYKQPAKVIDVDIANWIRYKNISRFRSDILKQLDADVLVHFEKGYCTLLPKGAKYVEKNISLEMLL